MKLLRMTATFGRLDAETLELQDGLNIVEKPNEAGKSTWSAFLLAMLYGVDTGERNTKNNLSVKTKYKPWSGRPMAGRLELEWQGRRITIERSAQGRIPLGQFSAYETESGLPVPGLTAETCGLTLTGAERSVFARSAFLGQSALAVDPDSALERRLAALTSSGEETVSCSETEKRLRDWKNHCRHNKTGLLPNVEADLRQIEDELDAIRSLNQETVTLGAQQQRQEREAAALEARLRQLQARADCEALRQKIRAADGLRGELERLTAQEQEAAAEAARWKEQLRLLDAAEQNARLAQLRKAEADCAAAKSEADRRREAVRTLPDAAALDRLLDESRVLASSSLPPQPEQAAAAPQLPRGFTPDREPNSQADEAVAALDRLAGAAPKRAPWYLPLALLLGGVAGLIFFRPAGILLLAAALGAFFWISAGQKREKAAADARQAEAQEILARFGAASRDEILQKAAAAAAEQAAYQKDSARRAAAQADWERARGALEARRAALRAGVAAFGGDPGAPEASIRAAQTQRQACSDAVQRADTLAQGFAQLRAAVGEAQEQPLPADWTPVDRAAAERALREAETGRSNAQTAKDKTAGRLAEMEPPEALAAQLEARQAAAGDAEGDPAEAERDLEACRAALAQTKTTLDRRRGLVDGKGDPADLEARREALEERRSALEDREAALSLALDTLDAANGELQRRFAPQLSQGAAEILGELTGGRYARLLMDRELNFRAQEPGAPEAHPISYLSCGTTDQVYLAVRLALCRLVLPPETPLVLDDALVNFDDDRAKAALALLLREAESRQILLFTCHGREKSLLSALQNGA